MQASHRKRLVIAILLLLLLDGLAFGIWRAGHRCDTWSQECTIGNRQAVVGISWTPPWALFQLGHQYLFYVGDDEYKVRVYFTNGGEFRFESNWAPKAIWELQGKYYVVLLDPGGGWTIAEIEDNGSMKQVRLKDLPPGQRDLNLVREEYRSESEHRFEDWRKMVESPPPTTAEWRKILEEANSHLYRDPVR
jgi:hypothetical protein